MSNLKETILEYAKIIVLSIIISYGVLFFIQISKVVGSSMEPTYHNGNIVLIDKFFYKQKQPSYNDVVVVKYKVDAGKDQIIKRIIGLEGDHIEVKDNILYRNGQRVDEPYILEPMVTNDFSYDIPEGKVFVMGDNRNHSVDSRQIGYVDFDEQVVGKAFFKVF